MRHFDLFRGSACLIVLALPISGCAMWPFQSGHMGKVAALPPDESPEAWHTPSQAMSKRSVPREGKRSGHFASITAREHVSDGDKWVLGETDPRRLTDLHHAPVGHVEEAALDVLPGTLQATHLRAVHDVMVGYHPRPVRHVSALHIPEVASQGLHRPSLAAGVN